MSRIRRISPGLGRGGLIGNTEGPESYLRELDTLPSQFCRATGGTETVISQGGKFYRVHTFTDTDPTSLLLNFDGSNGSTTFTDDSGWGHAVTANGDAAISTTESKFGGSSLYLDGTGDSLDVAQTSTLSFGTGDYTIEFWLYRSNATTGMGLIDARPTSSTAGWTVFFNASNKIAIGYNGTATTSSTAISTTTWQHIAFVRSSGTVKIYIDGVEDASGTNSGSADATQAVRIGAKRFTGSGQLDFEGYIDSLRITKGQALYTAAFTPPTTALTRVGSGSLTFTRGGAVEYLVVGGGGSGGRRAGLNNTVGGGGAGGYRSSVVGESSGGGASAESKLSVTPQSYTVTVGGGGAGQTTDSTDGNDGSASSFDGISSTGGGGGAGKTSPSPGRNGGSAGGSRDGLAAPNSGIAGQGSAGGTSTSTAGGGGGGAGAAGGAGSGSTSGEGGVGINSFITGTSVFRAGGGGGAGAGTDGDGGNGGGTAGVSSGASTAGAANTGGGSGASRGTGSGDGGSGIVIVRYRITQAEYEAEAA